MSSLALLAHEAPKATPAFNGLFYATIATVIPVLFLAIAVQSSMYERLLTGGVNAFARAAKMPAMDENTPWRELGIGYGRLGLFFGAILAAVGILIVAIVGEIQSLIALDTQHAEGWPLPATIILTVCVAIAPSAVLARSLRAWYRLLQESADEAVPGTSEPGTRPKPPSQANRILARLTSNYGKYDEPLQCAESGHPPRSHRDS